MPLKFKCHSFAYFLLQVTHVSQRFLNVQYVFLKDDSNIFVIYFGNACI